MKQEMNVIKVGHAFVKGKGSDKPRKDSIWGIMQNGDVLVKFFGRRNGGLRFKQEPIAELTAALELNGHKLAGTDAKKLKHDDLDTAKQAEMLGADWPQSLFDKYTAALAEGKIDLRVAKLPEEPKAKAPEAKADEATQTGTVETTAAATIDVVTETAAEAAGEAESATEDTEEAPKKAAAPAFFWPYPGAPRSDAGDAATAE